MSKVKIYAVVSRNEDDNEQTAIWFGRTKQSNPRRAISSLISKCNTRGVNNNGFLQIVEEFGIKNIEDFILQFNVVLIAEVYEDAAGVALKQQISFYEHGPGNIDFKVYNTQRVDNKLWVAAMLDGTM